MSYTIQYGTGPFDKQTNKKANRKYKIIAAVLLCILLLSLLFPAETAWARKTFLPFLEPQVREAFGSMAQRIGEGGSISDAAAAFCREILQEA